MRDMNTIQVRATGEAVNFIPAARGKCEAITVIGTNASHSNALLNT